MCENAAEVQFGKPVGECLAAGQQGPDFFQPKEQGEPFDGQLLGHLGSRVVSFEIKSTFKVTITSVHTQ